MRSRLSQTDYARITSPIEVSLRSRSRKTFPLPFAETEVKPCSVTQGLVLRDKSLCRAQGARWILAAALFNACARAKLSCGRALAFCCSSLRRQVETPAAMRLLGFVPCQLQAGPLETKQ